MAAIDRQDFQYVLDQLSAALIKSRPEPLELRSAKNKGIRWLGAVEPQIDGLSSDEDSAMEETSRLIASVLNPTILICGLSPIYVGKAEGQTLRSRLSQHVRDIESSSSPVSASPEEMDLRRLGRRIAAREMEQRSLYVVTIPIGEHRPLDLEYTQSQSQAIRLLERFLLSNANPNLSRQ